MSTAGLSRAAATCSKSFQVAIGGATIRDAGMDGGAGCRVGGGEGLTLGVDGVVEGAASGQGFIGPARVPVRHLGDVPADPHSGGGGGRRQAETGFGQTERLVMIAPEPGEVAGHAVDHGGGFGRSDELIGPVSDLVSHVVMSEEEHGSQDLGRSRRVA